MAGSDIERFVEGNLQALRMMRNPEGKKKHVVWLRKQIQNLSHDISRELKDKRTTLYRQYRGHDREIEQSIRTLENKLQYLNSVRIEDNKMNKWTKFIDSCVGNIARKIQDEFDESKHPRDKGGKFTSKGGEGRGGGKEEKLPESKGSSERKNKPVKASTALKDTMDDDLRQISENADSKEEFLENAKSYLEDYLLGDLADGDYAEENFEMSSEDVEAYVNDYIESGKLEKVADRYYGKGEYSKSAEEVDEDEGYMGMSKKELQEEAAEEDEWENRKDKMRRGSRNRRTYEEDQDEDDNVSLAQYKENFRENLDEDDEDYGVEERYEKAKFHSEQFKKLKNGEFYGTPKEKQLKNHYRRLGIKKPEDAFKVWWDI